MGSSIKSYNLFSDEKKELWRNESWIFYKTGLTVSATKWGSEKWKLKNIGVVYAESRPIGNFGCEIFEVDELPAERSFLIIDTKNNEFIHETSSYESLLYHLDFMGIAKSFKK